MSLDKRIDILVNSSAGAPYTVTLYLEEDRVSAFCSCPAGNHRRLCKHVTRIMNRDESVLYSTSQEEAFARITSHIRGTAIPFLVSEVNDTEILLQNAQRDAKKAKNALEKAVVGR